MRICEREFFRVYIEANSWEPIFPRSIVFNRNSKQCAGRLIGVNPEYERLQVEYEIDGAKRQVMVSQWDVIAIGGAINSKGILKNG